MRNKQNAMHTPLNNEEEFENMEVYEPDEIIESSPNRKYVKLGCRLGSSNYKKIFRAKQKVPYTSGELPEVNEHGEVQEYKKVGVVWNVVTVSSLDQELIDKNTYIEEMERIKACKHPNLIRIIDSWQYEDDYVTITEEMSEGNIKEYIGKHGMPTRERLLDWLHQILAGLKCMHGMHIIHKNLKCSNVFLSVRDGTDIVKLGDFGISEAKFKNRMPTVGTPEFLPREIYEGSRYTEEVDVYSLGFLLIELCTGTWPYAECKDEFDLLKKVLLGQLPSAVHKIRDSCLKHLIFRCITSVYDRITVDELLEHHVFFPDEQCNHFCICERPGTVLQLARSKNNLQCTLISIQPDAMHLQLHLPESEQFIRFKFHHDKDTIDSVMSEMLEEEIIRTNMYAELCDLFKTSIERAKKIKSLNIVEEGIFDVGMIEIKQIQLGEHLIMDVDQGYAYASRGGGGVNGEEYSEIDYERMKECDVHQYASPDETKDRDVVDQLGMVDKRMEKRIREDESEKSGSSFVVESREVYGQNDAPVLTVIRSDTVVDGDEDRSKDERNGKDRNSDKDENGDKKGDGDKSTASNSDSITEYNGESTAEDFAAKDASTAIIVNPLESSSLHGVLLGDSEKEKEARNGAIAEYVIRGQQGVGDSACQNNVEKEGVGSTSGTCNKIKENKKAENDVLGQNMGLKESVYDGDGTYQRMEQSRSMLVSAGQKTEQSKDSPSIIQKTEQGKDSPSIIQKTEQGKDSPSIIQKTEHGKDITHDEKAVKDEDRVSIEDFVNETASIVNRTPDIANEWVKLLKEQEIDTVEDLKLLVEEDWDALGLPVFAARAMMNTLYGKDRQPVKEKHQTTNTSIPEYTDDLQIKDFIVDVCTLACKIENASLWEAKLTNQEIRTVGEFKSLHSKDWNKLGLSVFCYRILKNILNRKGRLPFVR
ncbi:WNK protein kinase [Vavraia culicis subsp. floridensis]|uniref:WNK protein kinase n=1 Tax=Vavraia culicis (isolate floridensis) TaxID=948595 RepID=L2GVE0_VAVCU|nr:WNK protein kinase [Vavraia culicis subsp. floridensis]ELA47636.1 WNK protein kinase [Vavraia culicis subsp. floridensis]